MSAGAWERSLLIMCAIVGLILLGAALFASWLVRESGFWYAPAFILGAPGLAFIVLAALRLQRLVQQSKLALQTRAFD